LGVVMTSDIPATGLRIDAYGSEFEVGGERVRCPLAGRHQVENALTACAALQVLRVPPNFDNVVWPGRLERISETPEIILDGAHNPAGARALAAHIREFYGDREVWIVYGAMRDKAVEEITEILFPLAKRVILTAPDQARALRPEALATDIDHTDVLVAPTADEALRAARAAPAGAAVFVTGSLYLVGEVRRIVS
jgi:dihydrofolate synthase/folylpolyglutamate synthase